MSSRPWYKWFPGDYLQDTVHLTPEADLLYRRLLDIHWRDGSIPSDIEEIAELSRLPMEWVEPAWESVKVFFHRRGGRGKRLVNNRLDGMLRSFKRVARSSRDGGKASANKRLRSTLRDPDPDPDPDPDLREEKIPPNSPPKSKSRPVERARFQRPDVCDVTAYCRERRNQVDPRAFVDYYESKGWLVGKSPMKDWRAAVRTWERKDASGKPKAVHTERLPNDYYNPDGTMNAKYTDRKRSTGIGSNHQPVEATPRYDAERPGQGSAVVDDDASEAFDAIRLAAGGPGDG